MFDMKNLSKLKMLDDNIPKAMKAFWDFNNATFEDGAISSAERAV